MRKYFIVLSAIMCLLCCVVQVQAATDLFYADPVRIDSTGILSGNRASTEVTVLTTDTLTASQSGLVSIATQNTTYTLPAASVGLNYTFVAGVTCTINVDPSTTDDTIAFADLDAGDKMTSPGASTDSVTLMCGAANTWYVISIIGTWTDGGA